MRPIFPNGGMMTENTVLDLPGGRLLFGLSFKGDSGVWASGVTEYARSNAVLVGEIAGGNIVLSDGTRVPVDQCAAEFYQSSPRTSFASARYPARGPRGRA